ncbi:MAG: hypothetical protein J3K34DRAFT_457124 [Monoraphidium minutum]|nr:MAG: hypothetical protein J3K34DRAFT_457124 [Monoraphidium minutum]
MRSMVHRAGGSSAAAGPVRSAAAPLPPCARRRAAPAAHARRALPHAGASASGELGDGDGVDDAARGWTLMRALSALRRQMKGAGASPAPAGPGSAAAPAAAAAPSPSPGAPGRPPPRALPPSPAPAAAECCPIECLPSTPTEVIRALAPAPIATAAAAVAAALLDAGAAAAGPAAPPVPPPPDARRALRALRGRLSPEAWAAFAAEVERAALRAALQHPPAAAEPLGSLASLGSLGASYWEAECDDDASDGGGSDDEPGRAAAGAAAGGGYGGAPFAAAHLPGAARLHHVSQGGHAPGHQQQPLHHHQQNGGGGGGHTSPILGPPPPMAHYPSAAAAAAGAAPFGHAGGPPPQPTPPPGPWPPQGEGDSYGGWSTLFRSDGLRAAALQAAASAAAASAAAQRGAPPPQHFVGSHPITVLPSYGLPVPPAPGGGAAGGGDAPAAGGGGGSGRGSPAAESERVRAKRRDAAGRRSPSGRRPRDGPPHFSRLVFGGGGARTLAYAGALHALRQLGLVRRLDAVAGSSGGAILAVLAALGLGPQEILEAMATLPDPEQLSWMGLNKNLGLASGQELFGAIEQAVAQRTGAAAPTLGDVEAASGVRVFIATTSLAKRAPLYLDSRTHAGMRVRDALRASAAIPFFFSPVRSPFAPDDLLVDGCITDCTPVGAILGAAAAKGGRPPDPSSVLVLAVHDAAGPRGGAGVGVAADLNGLVNGLVATALQAGFHHTLASGVRVLNLFDAAAAVDPLQFRMGRALGRDVVARAQELTEQWAVELCSSTAAGAAAAVAGSPAAPQLAATGSAAISEAQLGAAAAGGDAQAEGAVPGAAGVGAPQHNVATAAAVAAIGAAAAAAAASPGRTALHASMGGGGGGGASFLDAAGHELGYGCDCRPWWLESIDDGGAGPPRSEFERLA